MKISPQAVRDAVGFVGVGLLGYGFWLHYPPLGFIAAGGCLLALTLAGTLRRRAPRPPPQENG